MVSYDSCDDRTVVNANLQFKFVLFSLEHKPEVLDAFEEFEGDI
jgi:hypothetical protein